MALTGLFLTPRWLRSGCAISSYGMIRYELEWIKITSELEDVWDHANCICRSIPDQLRQQSSVCKHRDCFEFHIIPFGGVNNNQETHVCWWSYYHIIFDAYARMQIRHYSIGFVKSLNSLVVRYKTLYWLTWMCKILWVFIQYVSYNNLYH